MIDNPSIYQIRNTVLIVTEINSSLKKEREKKKSPRRIITFEEYLTRNFQVPAN